MADSNPTGEGRSPDNIEDIDPEAKGRASGKTANEGNQAGPSSDEAGATIAPQKGDPRSDARQG